METKIPFIIAIDFDGTIKSGHFRDMDAEPVKGAIEGIRELVEMGCKLILWTCRSGEHVTSAIEYLKRYDVFKYFSKVNEEYMDYSVIGFDTDSPKIFADRYFDDLASGWAGWGYAISEVTYLVENVYFGPYSSVNPQ